MKPRNTCRVCLGDKLEKLWDFGMTPLANSYLTKEELNNPKTFYPLIVNKCVGCGNLQLSHVIDPRVMFENYLYVSSTSKVFRDHFINFANTVNPNFIIDIGSNDGILLKPFKDRGIRVLGVDPAVEIAKKATEEGIPTIPEFFDTRISNLIVKEYGQADLITATNVFAHIDDLEEVISGVKIMLNSKGGFVVEVPDLDIMLRKGSFDLIYHEHLNYWNEKSLTTFFNLHNMLVDKVERTPVHGGSLRVYAKLSK
jgi:SAM-dependent methyltransferase